MLERTCTVICDSHYPQTIVALTRFDGGGVLDTTPLAHALGCTSGSTYKGCAFSGKTLLHGSEPWKGRRLVLIAFTDDEGHVITSPCSGEPFGSRVWHPHGRRSCESLPPQTVNTQLPFAKRESTPHMASGEAATWFCGCYSLC